MTGYTDTIRRYATDTRFAGSLEDADGIGEVGLGAQEAGRKLAVRFTLRLRGQRVETLRFQVFGCGFTIAACTAAAQLAEGQPLATVAAIDPVAVAALLGGLPAERGYCAELAVEALQAALQNASSAGQAPLSVSHDLSGAEHGPRVSAGDPAYRRLLATAAPVGIAAADRHLFACLLAVAAGEPYPLAAALGLEEWELAELLQRDFPGIAPATLEAGRHRGAAPPAANPEVLAILRSHLPAGDDPAPGWLVQMIAARAAHPGHLWVAMGLFERPELTAAIRRLLPSLAAANSQGMRWKRFLFRQVCDLQGATLCKAPDCGVCSDYALCFPAGA
jgi:nitrogen fixation protein NifQ